MTVKESSPGSSKVKILTIDADRVGQRIDNYLVSQLKGVPKSRIYRLLRRGEVRVNKGRIKADYRLQAGDQIRIPPVRVSDNEGAGAIPAQLKLQINESILYEDKELLILNKPSGLAVHGGSGLDFGVIEALRILYPDQSMELVHRLDKHTSGCLVIAKNRRILRQLHDLFRGDGVKKHYLALVRGEWSGGKQQVNVPLQKNVLKSGERIVNVSRAGKTALSIFKPLAVSAQSSLMDVEICTGRTHQIRVHATHIGYPIAGDDKYGDSEFNKTMKSLGLRRLFLHAQRLEFTLPDPHKKIKVSANLPRDLVTVLEKLNLTGY